MFTLRIKRSASSYLLEMIKMEKCSCCVSRRKNELEHRKESDLEVYEMVLLPVKTQRNNIEVFACPSCDGNVLERNQNAEQS